MINYLLLYQFPLLYCVTVVLGLIVYGSDFDMWYGKLYLLPFLVLPIIHPFAKRAARRLAGSVLGTDVLLASALTAAVIYRELHLGFWDEHAPGQAILLAVLGILSYLSSLIGAVRITNWSGEQCGASVRAWFVLGVVWLVATYYPMVALLGLALITAIAGIWGGAAQEAVVLKPSRSRRMANLARYSLFVLFLDLSLVIWDYQVNTAWAVHLGVALIAAGIGYWIAFGLRQWVLAPVVALTVVNFVAAVVHPPYVLASLHSVVAGVSIGAAVAYLATTDREHNPLAAIGMTVPLFLGMAFGYLFYANLAHSEWRWVLLLPLLWFAYRAYAARSRAKDQSQPAAT